MSKTRVEVEKEMLELNMTCWNKALEMSMVMSCVLDNAERVLKESAKWPWMNQEAVKGAEFVLDQMQEPINVLFIMSNEFHTVADQGFDLADELTLYAARNSDRALQSAAVGV